MCIVRDDCFFRDTWAEINLDAIESNMKNISKYVKENPFPKYIYAVVKANAYGHGDVEVAEVALSSGANGLAVAFLDEALVLRVKFPNVAILVMGVVNTEYIEIAANNNIDISIHDYEWFEKAKGYSGKPINVHLMLDTGMNRLGFKDEKKLKEVVDDLLCSSKFITKGAFTHFATADEIDPKYFLRQLKIFKEKLKIIEPLNVDCIHAPNSAATLKYMSEFEFVNAVRVGIALYGLSPVAEKYLPIKLEQVLGLYSKVSEIKVLTSGEKVGYGATYLATNDELIAVIPIGYADGWFRSLNHRNVKINNKSYPIVGCICMDQMMVKVDKTIKVGDIVSLIDKELTVDDVADNLGTINYEVVCMISDRVPRVYFKNNVKVGARNFRYSVNNNY